MGKEGITNLFREMFKGNPKLLLCSDGKIRTPEMILDSIVKEPDFRIIKKLSHPIPYDIQGSNS